MGPFCRASMPGGRTAIAIARHGPKDHASQARLANTL
jgi:hypothetical protein